MTDYYKDLQETPYIFTYGNLMKGFFLNDLVKYEEFIGDAVTKDDNFSMFVYKGGTIPNVTDNTKVTENREQTAVKGEVYKIKSTTSLRFIDIAEGTPFMYKRNLVDIVLKETDQVYKCWYYESQVRPNGTHVSLDDGCFVNYMDKLNLNKEK